MFIQSDDVASPKSTPVRLSETAAAAGREPFGHELDEPLEEPLDDPNPEPLDEPVWLEPPELEELPKLAPLLPGTPVEHASAQAPQANAPPSPWVATQLDSVSLELQVIDWAFGALKSPPGQMQSR
jgi:hypothetical protein